VDVAVRTLRGFQRRADEIARGVESSGGILTQTIADNVHRTLVLTTPVGGPPSSPQDPHPGLARSNWLVAVGKGAIDLSRRDPRPENETIREGAYQISRVTADDEVSIANGGNKVPYLGLLNRGWSFQAPAGFVKIAVFAGIKALRGFKLLGRREGAGARVVR